MLGDKIGESSGRVTMRRVLPNPGGTPKMETSFEASGKLMGVETTETGTYWSALRPDGTLYGEGQGIVMGRGGETATWVGQGVGTLKKDGGVSYRGALYYQTGTSAWAETEFGGRSVRVRGRCQGRNARPALGMEMSRATSN